MNQLTTILTIILPLIGAGIGYFFKQGIEKKKELQSEVTKERRELYQQFVNLIIDTIKGTKVNQEQTDSQMIENLYQFYKKYILYASPEVIVDFSEYFQYIYSTSNTSNKPDNKIHFRRLTKIMKAMRKDLGLSNKKLGTDGEVLFRALITDFDKLIA